MAIKVTLRKKTISNKRKSLYLDFYPAIQNPETGKYSRREFLGYYLIDNPKNSIDKLHNSETLNIAEHIRQKRDNVLNKPEIYSGYELEQLKIIEKGDQDFILYFRNIAKKQKESVRKGWNSSLKYLEDYCKGEIKFIKINESFCNDFKNYILNANSKKILKKPLSQNTAWSYFNKFKSALNEAYKDGFLQHDINRRIVGISKIETQRNFLTIEELNQLIKTPCHNYLIKNAALFSAITGIRFSDISKMIWKEIEYIEGNGFFIKFTQQKTKRVEMMPISQQAVDLLGEPKDSAQRVFDGLNYSSFHNKHLYQWIGAAGISKPITFHCFRHTYATLQLSKGTDIYTLSKMLGHRELKTTQIYAKVIDQTKRDAADKIILDFEK